MAAPLQENRIKTDEEVYSACADDLIRFAVGLVGRSDAQDVVSTAVVRSISSKSWPTVSDRRGYLFRAVLNQARNEHRDRQRRWAKELRGASDGVSYLPDYRPEVLAAVQKLSLRQRAVIVLHYWEDLQPSAIAVRLGISEGSVRRHLARARAKLRGTLDE
ncbi:MAG: RNA polymerase sigma factor [Acidimicrobiia bacterium]